MVRKAVVRRSGHFPARTALAGAAKVSWLRKSRISRGEGLPGRNFGALILVPAALLMLSACGQADVQACEQFIKSGLKAPSTYKQISLKTYDEQLSLPEFLQRTGQKNLHPVIQRGLELQAEDGLGLRTIVIESEAANGYGVPIRSTDICAFKLVGGKVEDKRALDMHVSSAENRRSSAQLREAGYLPASQEDGGAFPCCV